MPDRQDRNWESKRVPGGRFGRALFIIRPGVAALWFLVLSALPATTLAAGETRGLWVVRHTLTDRGEIDRLFDLAALGNFNTLFVQVVGKGEAYYRSSILPQPESLIGVDSDPFAYLVARAKASGLEIHAWVNCFYVWSGPTKPPSPRHVVNDHPDWVTRDRAGRSLLEYSPEELRRGQVEGIYLSPGNPRVREYIQSIAREIARRYDIDGIHLDYIRYPAGDFGYDRESRRRFHYLYRADPLELALDPSELLRRHRADEIDRLRDAWPRWRAERVTETVRMVNRGVRTIKPLMRLSAAVYPDPQVAFDNRLQDWPRWLEEEEIDFVVVMNYSTSSTEMERLYRVATSGRQPERIYNGIGAWRLPVDSVLDKIKRSRQAGATGIVLFSYDGISRDLAYVRALRRGPFRRKADVAELPERTGRAAQGQ